MSLVDKLRAYLNEEEPEDNMSAEAIVEAKKEKKKNKKEKNKEKKIEKAEKRQKKAADRQVRDAQIQSDMDENVQTAYKPQVDGSAQTDKNIENVMTTETFPNTETVENAETFRNIEFVKSTEAVGSTVYDDDAGASAEASVKQPRKKKKFGLFGRKKHRKAELEEENNADEINNGRQVSNDYETVKDFCEQLIDVSYHMEDMKREYRVVTEYLTDIQRIEELPINIVNDITDVARKIEMLDKNRQLYLQSENLLSVDEYNLIASMEKEIPETVKTLMDMEMRDAMLKSDMSHLEGEKESLRYMRNEYSGSITKLRGILTTTLIIFLITSVALLSVAMATQTSVTLVALILGAIAALVFTTSYVKYLDLKASVRESDAKIKRAISLLNKVKVKYINNTNTLEYIYGKYGVNSCKELEYLWEQYNIMVRDARKYTQTNCDLRVYSEELVEKLTKLGLRDPSVWPKQVNAIIDRREMVEIKHGLNVRRQKIREKLESCEQIRNNAKSALRAAVSLTPGMERYIAELLSSYNMRFEE